MAEPSDASSDFDPDSPTALIVDSDAAQPDNSPAGILQRFLKGPGRSEPSPSADAAANTSPRLTDCSKAVLRVRFGDSDIDIKCTADALLGYVSLAYMAGGFPAVLRARHAIDDAVNALANTAKQAGVDASQGSEQALIEHIQAQPHTAARDRDIQSLQQGAAKTQAIAKSTKAAAQAAAGCQSAFSDKFRDAWKFIAAVEEGLLRDYEKLAETQLKGFAANSKKLAGDSWTDYKCYPGDDTTKTPIAIEDAVNSDKNFRLGLSEVQLKQKFNICVNLKSLAAAILTNQQDTEQIVAAAERRHDNPDEQRVFHEKRTQDYIAAFDAARAEVHDSDPALLQVYTRLRGSTQLRAFESLIIDALLDAWKGSDDIIQNFVSLTATGQLRVDAASTDGTDDGYDADERRAISTGGHWDHVEQWQLTVPAGVVIAQRLQVSDTARNSAWLHLPVRLAVAGATAAFDSPGSIEFAVITHLWDALEELRQQRQKSEFYSSLILWGAAAVLAPFTDGVSLIAAASIQAALNGAEILEAREDYKTAAHFSDANLSVIEATLWTRPSTIKLVQLIAARTTDSALAFLTRLPLVAGLLLGAAASVIAPAAPTTRPDPGH